MVNELLFHCLREQGLLSLGDAFKVELSKNTVHQCLDLVIAEVANGTLVCVVDIHVCLKRASLNLQSHLFVSIAEGHSLGGEAVDLFHGEPAPE